MLSFDHHRLLPTPICEFSKPDMRFYAACRNTDSRFGALVRVSIAAAWRANSQVQTFTLAFHSLMHYAIHKRETRQDEIGESTNAR
jgi:hypothetical protein